MISDQNNPSPAPDGGSSDHRAPARSRWPMAVASVILGLAIFGSVRLWQMGREVERLSRQVEESVRTVEAAAERSEEALIRASQAEENALQAAHGRELAERARAEYERIAEGARREAQAAREEAEQVRKEREAELERMEKALGRIAETRRTALGLVMSLGEDTLRFDFDKATLRPEHRETLSRIAGVLLASKGYRIDIYGHTDDIGTEEYNLRLSQRRAQAVRSYLVEAGIDPEIISTKGYGKSSPRVKGTAPQARAANRRVEIAIIDSVIQLIGPAQAGNR
jgi:outer membrane protein OmpA-like peptidoglycan-associated protein